MTRSAAGRPRVGPAIPAPWRLRSGWLHRDEPGLPDSGLAIVVLTNLDANVASETIATGIADLMLVADSPADAAAVAEAQRVFQGLQHGQIDVSRLTPNARTYFTAQALKDYHSSLGPLGPPVSFTLVRMSQRGGLTSRFYDVEAGKQKLRVVTRSTGEGLYEQDMVAAQ